MQSPFSFLQPTNADQVVDQYSLGQKQALINALKQSALQPQQPQQFGTVAARTSPITPIVQALSGYLAGQQQHKLDKQYGDLANQQSANNLALMTPQTQPIQPQQSPQPEVPQDLGAAMASLGQPQQPSVPRQLATALSAPSPEQQPMRDPKFVTSMNPGGFEPHYAANQLQMLGREKYTDKYIEPFIKPKHFERTVEGLLIDPESGQYYDADRKPLNDAQVQARIHPDNEKPMDELAKLNADYKAGRLNDADYKARRELMTTRAPSLNSPVNEKDPKVESAAQRIARYDAPPLTGAMLNRPFSQAVMDRVEQIHAENGTTYHGEEYPTRQAAYKAFSSGKQGDQVRSFNVGISHLQTAQDLAEALGNGDIRLLNKARQAWAEQTGSAAPTNLDTAKEVIKAEIVKSISGAGGGVADREKALAGIDKAASPAQLKGAIATAQKLMGGQLGGLKRQYEQSTGRNDFERLLSKDSLPYLSTKEGLGDSSASATPTKGWGKAQVVQ